MSKLEEIRKNVKTVTDKSGTLSQEKMTQALDWCYNRTLQGLPGQKTIDELINDYLSKYDKETAIDKLVKYQTTKAAISGFVTGFGGVITMPVTIPANITSVILFQMRMIAAIAKIRGYELRSDQVQTVVYKTLAGTTVTDIVKKRGIAFGNKLTISVIKKIPGKALTKINQAVGFRLVTKFGSKGLINLGKMVPVVGAVVGGAFDTGTTLTIARAAKKNFLRRELILETGQS
ncbi:EcsC family protein [Lactovum odontotermitis]